MNKTQRTLAALMATYRLPCLFFLALIFFYYSLSPAAIAGMGYGRENIDAGNQILSNLWHWLTLRHATASVTFPRHGMYEPILELPFLALGRLVFGSSFIFCYCRSVGSKPFEHSSIAPRKVVVIIAIVAALYLVNDHSRSLSATTQSGALGVLKTFGIRNPLFFFVNMYSLTVSINKGLIIYCPPILLALIALHRVHRESPRLAIFAGLALLGLMAGSSLLWCWSDETWGPRYLHAAIAPLLVSFAVTKKAVQFRFRKEIPLLVLVSLGVAVSFVGSLFYYGTLQRVATQTSQATIENFEYNPNWNHIRFNAKLLRLWFRGQTNGHLNEIEPWPPVQTRWYPFGGEGSYVETKQVSLGDYAIPQALMLQDSPGPHSLLSRLYRASFVMSLFLGSLMLVWAGRNALREDRFISKPYP